MNTEPRNPNELGDQEVEKIKIITNAFSQQNKISNRLWIFLSTLSVLVFSRPQESQDPISFLGIEFPSGTFFSVALLLINVGTIAFCVNQALVYRCSEIFEKLVGDERYKGTSFSEDYSWNNVAHVMAHSNLNRIFPLFYALPESIREILFVPVKTIIDIVYTIIPIMGIYICWVKYDSSILYLNIFIYALTILSSLAAFLLFWVVLRRNICKIIAAF